MVFSSVTFLFLFLPVTLIIYLALGKTHFRNVFLLFSSLFFYAWGEDRYVFVMLSSIVVNYFIAMAIAGFPRVKTKKVCLGFGLVINLGSLVYFKYTGFFVENLNYVLSLLGFDLVNVKTIRLPLGISFFTFQALSYLVEVYWGEVRVQRNILRLGLYISMFPQLVAGPIVRYNEIEGRLFHRKFDAEDFANGIRRFVFGLAKKLLIANSLGEVADSIFSLSGLELSPVVAWLGIVCYTFQIYYDFSGYSDMAIGMGKMLGFQFPENFDYPYVSRSITAFWQRWHMTLSRFFRDFLYFPLGGSKLGERRRYLNLILTMFLIGLWHGAGWQFIFFGLFHGVALMVHKVFSKNSKINSKGIAWALTVFTVMMGWVLFRADNLSHAALYYQGLFGFNSLSEPAYGQISQYWNLHLGFILAVAACFSAPVYSWIQSKNKILFNGMIPDAFVFFLLLLAVADLSASTFNPFIYFRF